MSSTQWTGALVALILVVFGVTFTMNYLGMTDSQEGPDADTETLGKELSLYFGAKRYPGEDHTGIQAEEDVVGYQDFWFSNPNDEQVNLGLDGKNCSCASVDAAVLSPEAKKKMVGLCGLAGIAGLSAFPELQNALIGKDSGSAVSLQELKEHDPITIPPKSIGWVRMRWNGEKDGAKRLTASVWMSQRSNVLALESRLMFFPPIRTLASERRKVEKLPLTKDGLPHTDEFVCWSSTRKHFDITAKVVGRDAANDPFVLGKPIELTDQEREDLEKRLILERELGQVLFGYRIPVTIQKKSPNGEREIDIGPLMRYVEFESPDKNLMAQHLSYQARIHGIINIGVRNQSTVINFGTFPRSRGDRSEVIVWTEDPNVQLAIDEETTASFLKARFVSSPASDQRGRREWKLSVKIEPNSASGKFPRSDNKRYRDSAVYLRCSGTTNQRVRIPVQGIATIR